MTLLDRIESGELSIVEARDALEGAKQQLASLEKKVKTMKERGRTGKVEQVAREAASLKHEVDQVEAYLATVVR